ncbi:MAG: hypothetical protein RIT81_06895 [Deltaproteobacteria bacterium]
MVGIPRHLFVVAVMLAGCSGETVDPTPRDAGDAGVSDEDAGFRDGGLPPDAGPPPDAGTEDAGVRDGGARDAGGVPRRCDRARAPIAGGGASTEPLAGELEVFLVDRATGEPVVQADVVVHVGTSSIADRTDGVGCVVFEDPVLTGTVSVSVFDTRYAYRTVMGFARDRITMPMFNVGAGAPAVRPGRVLGIVDGFDVLTSSTAARARVGVVEPIRTDVFRRVFTQPPRGGGAPYRRNVAAVGGPSMANLIGYDVLVDARFTSGLVVWGGTEDANERLFTHLGISTGLTLEPDEIEMGRGLTITHPLDTPIVVRHGAALGLIERRFAATLVLANGEVIELAREVRREDATPTLLAAAPSLAGPLSGARYGGVVTEWQQSMDRGAFSTIVFTNTTTSTTVDVGPMPALPSLSSQGRDVTISVEPDVASYVRFEISNRWVVSVADGATTVRVPPVPAPYFDPLSAQTAVVVTALGLAPLDLQVLAAQDPYAEDLPLVPELARAIERWVQDGFVIEP